MSNELDAQNEREENTHTHTHIVVVLESFYSYAYHTSMIVILDRHPIIVTTL